MLQKVDSPDKLPLFELTISNRDKGVIDAETLAKRVTQFIDGVVTAVDGSK